jgi:signal transduction histidine kinase
LSGRATPIARPGQQAGKLDDTGAGWARSLTVPLYIGCTAVFIFDVSQEVFVPYGLFYLPLVCTAVFYRDPRWPWWLATLASALSVIGFFFPVINPDVVNGIINRILSVAAIFITAALVSHARSVQDRLAEQTGRAEAAERLKSEVFATLTDELRQPLHALTGLTAVMMAGCRPDQRDPLGQVQRSLRRLVATLDNLIDLTQFDGGPLPLEVVDVDKVVAEAACSIRPIAADRQITVAVDRHDADHHTAHGNNAAIRRILDNLLSNALRVSPPGSVIEMETETAADGVVVTVRETGNGMRDNVLHRVVEPDCPGERGDGRLSGEAGLGLALSRGLALSMGGELRFDSEIGAGTTVSLYLPA